MTGAQPQSTRISVMLIVSDAEAAVAWYAGTLGATGLWNLRGVAGLEMRREIVRLIGRISWRRVRRRGLDAC